MVIQLYDVRVIAHLLVDAAFSASIHPVVLSDQFFFSDDFFDYVKICVFVLDKLDFGGTESFVVED